MDNFFAIYRQIQSSLNDYEKESSGTETPYEKMLRILEAPYCEFSNYDEFLLAFQQMITEDEARIWDLYPDFDFHGSGKTPAQLADHCEKRLRDKLPALSESLAKKHFLIRVKGPETAYMRTYFFQIILQWIHFPDGSPLSDAVLHWWIDSVKNGGSAELRNAVAEYRVLPHEGTLTGDSQFGKIPMNLEIPDHREVLNMDQASQFLKGCRRYAVTECLCRKAQELNHTKECDFPINDVCIMFDEAADAGIASGRAREVTLQEALDTIRRCRDMGMMQVISDAEHPLALCNCCKCCCGCMNSLERFERTVAHPSRFRANVFHPENCIGCGTCVRLCPMDAPEVKDGKASIDTNRCIGCGVCVSKCPKGVLKMKVFPGESTRLGRERTQRPYI